MRTRTFALAALAAGLCLPAAAQPPKPEYKPYASSAGRYKVLFPGPVKTDTREVKADFGTLNITLDTVELPGEVTFLVTHLEYPAAAPKMEPAKRLDKVRDGNKGADGKVLAEKELTVGPDKHPAREVLIEKPSAVIRNRIVVAGDRLYQVMLQGPKDYVTGADADRFFDSFEVTR
jgi:hypothetical protein